MSFGRFQKRLTHVTAKVCSKFWFQMTQSGSQDVCVTTSKLGSKNGSKFDVLTSDERWEYVQHLQRYLAYMIPYYEAGVCAYTKNDIDPTKRAMALIKYETMSLREKLLARTCFAKSLESKQASLKLAIKQKEEEVKALYTQLTDLNAKGLASQEASDAGGAVTTTGTTRAASKNSNSGSKPNVKTSGPKRDVSSLESKCVDTALHVLKGAIVKTYGIPTGQTTKSVHFSDAGSWQGSLTVCHEKLYKPTDEMKDEIELLCNELIEKNVKVEIEEGVQRSEAEEKYGKEMYDKFAVPESVKVLNILHIKDWNVNCCPKPHVSKTGELLAIKLGKVRFNNKHKTLTLYFTVGEAAK